MSDDLDDGRAGRPRPAPDIAGRLISPLQERLSSPLRDGLARFDRDVWAKRHLLATAFGWPPSVAYALTTRAMRAYVEVAEDYPDALEKMRRFGWERIEHEWDAADLREWLAGALGPVDAEAADSTGDRARLAVWLDAAQTGGLAAFVRTMREGEAVRELWKREADAHLAARELWKREAEERRLAVLERHAAALEALAAPAAPVGDAGTSQRQSTEDKCAEVWRRANRLSAAGKGIAPTGGVNKSELARLIVAEKAAEAEARGEKLQSAAGGRPPYADGWSFKYVNNLLCFWEPGRVPKSQ